MIEFRESGRYADHPIAIISRDLPSDAELQRIAELGALIHIRSRPIGAGASINFLAPIAVEIRGLIVGDERLSDLSAVAEMMSLERLVVPAGRLRLPDLSLLPALWRFEGGFASATGLNKCKGLRTLRVHISDAKALEPCPSPVESLTLVSHRADISVPVMTSAVLRKFRVIGARLLDLQNLSNYTNLESVLLQKCGKVTNARALLQCDALKSLEFWNTKQIDDWRELIDLEGPSINIQGESPFDTAFRQAVAPRHQWAFPLYK